MIFKTKRIDILTYIFPYNFRNKNKESKVVKPFIFHKVIISKQVEQRQNQDNFVPQVHFH